MDKIADWIKIGIMVIAVVVTVSLDSCVTRREMNARFNGIQNQLDQAANERAMIREDIRGVESRLTEDIHRVEGKVEQLNQNYIEHLAHHNKKN